MPTKQKVTLNSIIDDITLWHHRHGHLNLNSLKVLTLINMVIGIPIIDVNKNTCEGCIMGKMHTLSFTKTTWRVKAPLQLVHTDIWGPACNPNMGGKRYFLLFVDDYTRMMWVYFLERKSQALTYFLQSKALIEK